jgi:catechol 2,3-dioxygenase-like lactoylglutathione lyase family enzyme
MTPVPSALGIVCTDLARSLAFYRALGLDIPADADDAPHVEVALDGGFRIMWDPVATVTSFDPSWSAAQGGPGTSLAFDCGTPTAVDDTYAAVVGIGYEGHLEPFDAFWGQRYATLRDPDGNGVDLFAALPT